MSAHLFSVNVTAIVHASKGAGSFGRTGIDKRPVASVRMTPNGVIDDQVIETNVHGGADKAVYAYSIEDLRWWEMKIGSTLTPGSFGENLTTVEIDLTRSVIGERWQIGAALLEIAQPRIPCRVFADFWKRPSLIKEFTQAARPGAYLRVIESGDVSAEDLIEVVSTPKHGVTLGEAFRARNGQRELVPKVLEAAELPASWHDWAHRTLSAK